MSCYLPIKWNALKIALPSWNAYQGTCLDSQVAIYPKAEGFITFNSEIYATAGTQLPVESTMVPVQQVDSQ